MILRGEKIYLKGGLVEENYPLILKWFKELEVVQYFSFAKQALELKNIGELKSLLDEIESGPVFEIYDKEDKFIGYTSLSSIREGNESEFSVFILNKSYWGIGVANEATRLTLDYAFRTLNVDNVTLDTSELHERAIGFYKKMGFKQADLINNDRTVFHNGEWILSGTVKMELDEEEFKKNIIDEYLQKKILPDLEKSRGGFDKIHTLEVVDWLKKIIEHNPELKLDETVLLIAAYAHDWGYSELFGDGEVMQFEKVENAKKLHMEIGAKKLEKLLEDKFFSFLTDEQKKRAIHLVAVHDKKYEIKDADELILMEADMLSALDINTEKPVFDTESNKKFMEAMLTTRIPKFITEFSKNEAKKLIKAREDFFSKMKNLI